MECMIWWLSSVGAAKDPSRVGHLGDSEMTASVSTKYRAQ
jgi:hypothetical protein